MSVCHKAKCFQYPQYLFWESATPKQDPWDLQNTHHVVSTALLAEIENESSPVSAPCRPNTVVQNEECHYPGAGIDQSDWALPTLQTDEYLTNRIVKFKSWKCCSKQPTSEKWNPNKWKGTVMFCLEVPWKTQFITIEATSLIKNLRIYWDASNISRSWKLLSEATKKKWLLTMILTDFMES